MRFSNIEPDATGGIAQLAAPTQSNTSAPSGIVANWLRESQLRAMQPYVPINDQEAGGQGYGALPNMELGLTEELMRRLGYTGPVAQQVPSTRVTDQEAGQQYDMVHTPEALAWLKKNGYEMGYDSVQNLSALMDKDGNPVAGTERTGVDSDHQFRNAGLLAASIIAGPLASSAAGGGATGAAAAGAVTGGMNAGMSGGASLGDIAKGAAGGAAMGYAGGALGEAIGGTGDAAWNAATDEALAGSGNYYVGNNAAGIDAFNAGAFSSADDAAWQSAADEALAGSNNYYVGNNAAAIDAANASAFNPPSLNTDQIPSVSQETAPTVQSVKDTVPQMNGTETLADAGITPGSDFAQWLKDNPTTAIKLAGLFGGMLGGGGSSGNPGSTPGGIGSLSDQSTMTATPAVAQQRQYVAPPAGYRPGFDPEHKYFTGIGAVGTGNTIPSGG